MLWVNLVLDNPLNCYDVIYKHATNKFQEITTVGRFYLDKGNFNYTLLVFTKQGLSLFLSPLCEGFFDSAYYKMMNHLKPVSLD